jgi:hypothetical protein
MNVINCSQIKSVSPLVVSSRKSRANTSCFTSENRFTRLGRQLGVVAAGGKTASLGRLQQLSENASQESAAPLFGKKRAEEQEAESARDRTVEEDESKDDDRKEDDESVEERIEQEGERRREESSPS